MNSLYTIQQEYFEIIRSNPLISACTIHDENQVSVPKEILDEKPIILLPRNVNWKPTAVKHIESLFEKINDFWQRNIDDIKKFLSQNTEKYIHVPFGKVEDSLRKYGCFFNGLLVSDQLMISRNEYLSLNEGELANWKNLVTSIVQTAFRYLSFEHLTKPNNGKSLVLIVPPLLCLDGNVNDRINEANSKISIEFLSSLMDRSFNNEMEFIEFVRAKKPSEDVLNPHYRNLLYSYDKAGNIKEYINSVYGAIVQEQGTDWIKQADIPSVIVLDLGARLREFERFATDAYLFSQEPELHEFDSALYEWWFDCSAKIVSHALGASYSTDFAIKLASNSHELGFLKVIEFDDLLKFLSTDPVDSLREDLLVNRINIKRSSNESLSESAEIAGKYVLDRIRNFDLSVSDFNKTTSKTSLTEGGKTIFSVAVSILSTIFPPIGAVSLIWGGSLADLTKARKKSKQDLQNKLDRPIATLSKWEKGVN